MLLKNHKRVNKEQHAWLQEKLKDFNCIYVGIHGSVLYGLDHEGSDIDIKAIYMPSKHDILRGKAIKTYNYKNDELDIEIEVKSISSFLRSAESCDTNCIDLLHAPEEMSLKTTELWGDMKQYRSGMYAKNMKGIVGYIKTHSKKYTNKIDRLNEMKQLLSFINFNQDESHTPANTVMGVANLFSSSSCKYIKVVKLVKDGEQQYLEVCGKKYIFTLGVSQLKEALEVEINRYGKRSNDGLGKGLDTKSLSHALRVLLQLKEIITTKDLQFPLKHVEYVKAVKLGEVTDVREVLNKIDTLYDECMELLADSDFPEEVDITEMFNVLEEYYFS